MNTHKIYAAFIVSLFITLAGCNFIGGVFKTGVGVGVFLVVALIVIIFLITRLGKKNKVG
jgi:hypothetical protein